MHKDDVLWAFHDCDVLKLVFKRFRTVLLAAFVCMSFSPAAEAQSPHGIPVLLYHHVTEDASDESGLTVAAAEFDKQMQAMRQAGFQTISLQEMLAYMKGSKTKLPAKPIVITFDDGYEDNYIYAFPLLKKAGFTAAIFMVGNNSDRKGHISAQNIRELTRSGVAIEGHSMTHPKLTTLTSRQLRFEVSGGRRTVARFSRSPVDFFAYPCGYYDLPAMDAVEAAGYQGAFTILTGLNRPDRDNIYLLRRIPVFSYSDFDQLLILLNGNQSQTSLLDFYI